MNGKRQDEPIAVVGMGLRLPGGVDSPESFWEFLVAGENGMIEVPDSRWDARRFKSGKKRKKGKINTSRGGFLKTSIDGFDPAFFGISPREAHAMDPQQRLLLEVSWEALENGGIPPASVRGKRVGVYVGGFTLDYKLLQYNPANRHLINSHTAAGNTMCMLANRISHTLDFRGPSLAVDTACSSSLVALHLACRDLWHGACDMALTGGVSLILMPEYMIAMSRGGFLSKDGLCKTFDALADGYGRGEGAGMIVLKTLSKALDHGDPVHGLIRRTAVNHGGRSQGISFPRKQAQIELLREVYQDTELLGSRLGYVEAHGTGTQAGDRAEAEALGEVIGQNRKGSPLLIGSVKTNIGHLEAAAGIAGVIKTILCLKHGELPPHLNLVTPNPKIPFDDLGLAVTREPATFPQDGLPRVAGVSGFGYGGANAHVVLEEFAHPGQSPRPLGEDAGRDMLLTLSARSRKVLAAVVRSYIGHIPRQIRTGYQLADIVYSSTVRGSHHEYRVTVTGHSVQQMTAKMEELLASPFRQTHVSRPERKLAFVFSGMGPQWWYMGRELYYNEPVFRERIESVDEVFQKVAGWSILQKLLADEHASEINITSVAQAANFALQTALAALWHSWGIRADAVVGHSVGEVSAALYAGALTLEDACLVVFQRSSLQQRLAGDGAMLAVGLGHKAIGPYLSGLETSVDIAAVNSAHAVTLSGTSLALGSIASKLEADAIFHRFTGVDIPYHSRRMEPLKEPLLCALAPIHPQTPRIPFFSTVSGQKVLPAELGKVYWWENVRKPVQFLEAVQSMVKEGSRTFIEIGPHPVLCPYIKEILHEVGISGHCLSSQTRRQPQRLTMLESLAALYRTGHDIDWSGVYQPREHRFVPPPHYPWVRKAYFQESDESRKNRFGPDTHVLLGSRVNSPHLIWQAVLNDGYLPYLDQHKLHERVVFPAAAYVETALALAREQRPNLEFDLVDLQFHTPLVPDEIEDTLLRTEASANGVFAIYAAGQNGRGDWSKHATGKILWGLSRSGGGYLCLQHIQARCSTEISARVFYRAVQNAGLEYGSMFRNLGKIHTTDCEVLARLEAHPTVLAELLDYWIHPVLFDAGLQALLVAGFSPEGPARTAMIPVSIGRVSVFKRLDVVPLAYLKVSSASRDLVTADLILCGEDGEIYMEARDVKCKALPRGRASKTLVAHQSWLYEEAWREIYSPEMPAVTGERVWLVFLDPAGDLAKPLGELLGKQSGRFLFIEADTGFVKKNPDRFGIRPGCPEDLDRLFQEVGLFEGILFFCNAADVHGEAATLAGDSIVATTLVAGLAQAVVGFKPPAGFRFCLVTRDARSVRSTDALEGLSQAPIWGLGRVIMNEHPELGCRLVDLGKNVTKNELSMLLADCFRETREREIALRWNRRWAAHLVRIPHNRAEERQRVPLAAGKQVSLVLAPSRSGQALSFREAERKIPGLGEVEIEIYAAAINPDDLDRAAGAPLGLEASGTVVALGPGVNAPEIGQQVVLLGFCACYSRYVIVSLTDVLLLPKPKGLTREEAASFLAYPAVVHALGHMAGIQRGQRLLIHAEATPLALAALQYATSLGVETYAIASSPKNRAALARAGAGHVLDSGSLRFDQDIWHDTDGGGIHVILAVKDTHYHQCFTLLALNGHFIRMFAQKGADTASRFSLRGFPDNRQFMSLDLRTLFAKDPHQFDAVLEDTASAWQNGCFSALPTRVFPATCIEAGFRYQVDPSNMEQALVHMAETDLLADPKPRSLFRRGAAYLVIGGMGGLGQALVDWMMQKGCRHLALASRGGPLGDGTAEWVSCLRRQGMDVFVVHMDVSEQSQVEKALAAIKRQMPALAGIFHVAGVLDDGPLRELSPERFHAVMSPKVRGAWNLHRLSANLKLDYFVMFSSAAATLGNFGQANYAAGNAFMDGLAHFRQAAGLPATSVNWGPWAGAGMAVRDSAVSAYLARNGFRVMPPDQALASLETLLAMRDTIQPCVMDLDWDIWSRHAALGQSPSPFQYLVSENGGDEQAAKAGDHLLGDLSMMEPEQRLRRIEAVVRGEVASVLNLPEVDINCYKPLHYFGMDSLMSIEASISLGEKIDLGKGGFGVRTDLTVTQIANHILNRADLFA